MMDLDATLAQLATHPDHPVDLAGLGLHLAADEYPGLDVPIYLARLDDLADRVRPRLSSTPDLSSGIAELAQFLFEEEGFAGNAADYYDARNSYLNNVLDRKLGIPITLSVLAMAVGERVGLPVRGLGLPGHFVAMVENGPDPIIFDPYHGGQLLDRVSCEALVEAVTGQPFTLTPDLLQPTPTALIVLRMLSNLKGIYLRSADYGRAARVIGRMARLCPTDPTQLRDLGVALVHAGRPGAAINPLQTYLDRVPGADDAVVVHDFLREAQRDVARWN